jgi:hypothetical protein
MVETIQQFKNHKPKSKGHPHPWRDGTQFGAIEAMIGQENKTFYTE